MNHRSSTDAAMIKLLSYESARMNKDKMITMNYDATTYFDRMYHEYGNMLNAKKKLTVRYASACQGLYKEL